MRALSTRQRLLLAPFLVATISLPLLLAAPRFDPEFNPHSHFRQEAACPKCHLVFGGTPDPDRFSPEASEYCLDCHSGEELGRSHPIGVRPREKYWKMKVPEEYRLDDDGRLMCLTCHFAHGPFLSKTKAYASQKPENPDALPGTPYFYRTRFARRADPVKGFALLCDGCHKLL